MTLKNDKKTPVESLGELEVLFKISQVISSCSSPGSTYDSVLDLLEELVDFDFGALFIFGEQDGRLNLVASKGHAVDLIQPVSFDMGNGLSAWVAKQKRPILLSKLHRGRSETENLVRSFISIPLMLSERVVGVMNFGHHTAGAFTRHHLRLLTIAAGQLSVIIERTIYFQELAEKNVQLKETNRTLEQTRQTLVEQERLAAVGEVAVTVNHEINNPLTVIIGNAELLLRDMEGSDPSLLRKLENIVEESKRIARITRALQRLEKPVTEDYLPGGRKMISLDGVSGSEKVEAAG